MIIQILMRCIGALSQNIIKKKKTLIEDKNNKDYYDYKSLNKQINQ